MSQPPIVYPQNSPCMAAGGHLNATTAASGSGFTAFADHACRQVTIANNTGTAIEVQQDASGVAFPVFNGTYFTFYGLTNASQLGVRRVDQSGTQVTVNARWES